MISEPKDNGVVVAPVVGAVGSANLALIRLARFVTEHYRTKPSVD